MKQFIFFIVFSFLLGANVIAQSFQLRNFDFKNKSGEVIVGGDKTTIVTLTDSTITIDTQDVGKSVYYYYRCPLLYQENGNINNLVQLTDEVWGFRIKFVAIPEELYQIVPAEARKINLVDIEHGTIQIDDLLTSFIEISPTISIDFLSISKNMYIPSSKLVMVFQRNGMKWIYGNYR